LRNKSYTAKTC